jgi:hypothetical protein
MALRIRYLAPAALLFALAMPSAHATSTATATRNYDCSKAGNANKTACRGAVAKAAPRPAPMPRATTAVHTTAPTPRHYDCSKAGNANKMACRGAVAAPMPRATPAARTMAPATAPHNQATTGRGPQGASAQCKDGSYSHSAVHAGACSHHAGVKQWY